MSESDDHDHPRALDHERCEPLLSAFLLEELEEAERLVVAAHLRGCPRCREDLSLLKAAAEALAGKAVPTLALSPREREALLDRARTRGGWLTPGRAALAAAALILVGGLWAGLELQFREAPGGGKEEARGHPVELARAPAAEGVEHEVVAQVVSVPAPVDASETPLGRASVAPLVRVSTEWNAEKRKESLALNLEKLGTLERGFAGTPYYLKELEALDANKVSLAAAPGAATPAPIPAAAPAGVGAGVTSEQLLARRVLGERQPPPSKDQLAFYGQNVPDQEGKRGELPALLAMAGGAVKSPATAQPLPPADWKVQVDDFLSRLERRPGETPAMMFFRYFGDNPFVEAAADPVSTFAADVDTASYTLFRSYLYKQGLLPPPEAIRTEEFVNYFKMDYTPPGVREGRAFAIHTELAPSPFAHESGYLLLKVGLKGREVFREKRKAASLVFVVDTSGSMRQENRLELVKDSLRLLSRELDEGDSIGIVAFDAEARKVLDPTPASEKERILDAIGSLAPHRNTNVAAGLRMGYQMAGAHLRRDATNRVILLSDGVANTGVVDPSAMLEETRAERQKGIYLSCVGVGMGNHNDALLEELARKGDGRCVYVDRLEEARKVFVENLTGTLETIARDVKIQVEFDPRRVIRYRLLGYENRAMADSDFRNNTADAGEVGAGHEVTSLYELGPARESEGTIATVRVRYKTVEDNEAQEIQEAVLLPKVLTSFAEAAPRFQLAACVAEAAEVLRESYWARSGSLDRVAALLEPLLPRLAGDQDVVELVALLKRADPLVRQRRSEADQVARAAEVLKENRYLRARLEDEIRTSRGRADLSPELEALLRENDALRARLEELLRR